MFTDDQTGRPASSRPDLQKISCGSCAVCKIPLHPPPNPKLLPCLHAVCQGCVTETRRDGETHECPVCVESFRLSEVMECIIFEDASNNNEAPKCAGCEESEVSGWSWCVQCEEALCVECVSAHHRVKVTRDHEVLPKELPKGWMLRRRCPLHRQESLRFFCLVCDELTCKDCQLITHRGHSFVQQDEALGSQRQQMQILLESIRKQKETVCTSLQFLEQRLQDIEKVKVDARKKLTQVVSSMYQALVLRARQILTEVEAIYAEEVRNLLQRKTSLNQMEGYQDYIAAFIDKILSTNGHCLLFHKKRIETQVKKLLSQKTNPPETMMELHLLIQKDLFQGLMRTKKVLVPFSCPRPPSTPSNSVSGEGSNPPSEKVNSASAVTATNVHPVPPSSSPHELTKAIKSHSVNEVTATTNVYSTGASKAEKNSCPYEPSGRNPPSPAFTDPTTQTPASGPSLSGNAKHSAPIDGTDTLQSQSVTQCSTNLKSGLPIKALADSACDAETSVGSTDFIDMDRPESNLPTSTVSETDPKEPLPDPEQDPFDSAVPSRAHQDSLSTTTPEKCSPEQRSHALLRSPPRDSQDKTDQLSKDTFQQTKHWSVGMPRSFRELVEGAYGPDSLIENLNATPPADSTPCIMSEDITLPAQEKTTHDKIIQSDFEQETAKKEDIESAVTLECTKQFKRSLRVTLARLPISLPPCGQPLPQYRLTRDISADHILQEIQEGQITRVWRLHEDPIQSEASSTSVSRSRDSPLASKGHFCSVCQSAGVTLLCAKCGRAFHSDCHIPPIFTISCAEWVCLLCQDVNNEIVIYCSEQIRVSNLSVQDQRKCEKLLLTLLCNENGNLLYTAIKPHSKTTEFDIILGRLLGKRRPLYQTTAELVSDIWTLFDILTTSEKRDKVFRLQKVFQHQLNESFGKSLNASLLRCSSSRESRKSSVTQREKHKKTLRRMREFLTANCGVAAKKPCTDKPTATEGSGNLKAN